MKNFTVLFLTLIFSSATFAAEATYNCGVEFGSNVILDIQPAEAGSSYTLQGTLKAPSKDKTTDTLIRSKKIKLSGDIETFNGAEVFRLRNDADPRHQIFAQIGKQGEEARVTEIRFGAGDSTDETVRTCSITKITIVKN